MSAQAVLLETRIFVDETMCRHVELGLGLEPYGIHQFEKEKEYGI